jgi:hypothetical protein
LPARHTDKEGKFIELRSESVEGGLEKWWQALHFLTEQRPFLPKVKLSEFGGKVILPLSFALRRGL